jgi:hypothetical protein
MDAVQFAITRTTFPWTQQLYTIPHKQGGIVQMRNRLGEEVPLFLMLDVIQFLTDRMASIADEEKLKP